MLTKGNVNRQLQILSFARRTQCMAPVEQMFMQNLQMAAALALPTTIIIPMPPLVLRTAQTAQTTYEEEARPDNKACIADQPEST